MSINWSYLKYLLNEEHQCFVERASNPASSEWKKMLGVFKSEIENNVEERLKVGRSWGKGKWTFFPWVRISYPEIGPSPKDGIFIDYLFAWDDHEVYLTLLQGVDNIPKSRQKFFLIENKKFIQNNVSNGSFEKTGMSYEPHIEGSAQKKARAQSYANGMIFYKKYSTNSFPEDSQLDADLQEMIEIYKKVKALKIPKFKC